VNAYPASAPTRPIPIIRQGGPVAGPSVILVGEVGPEWIGKTSRRPVEVLGLLVVGFLLMGAGVALGVTGLALWAAGAL
jgi:hypothetical protein